MQRISKNVYAEIYYWGCNQGFLVTGDGVVLFDTPQQPIDAVRYRERVLEHGPIRYLINTEPHNDHIRGNAYFPGVEVIGQQGIKTRTSRKSLRSRLGTIPCSASTSPATRLRRRRS